VSLRIQSSTERVPLLFRLVKTPREVIALSKALLELGVQAAATRKTSHEITQEDGETAHVKAIIASR
jgi:hypothetical protein